MRRQLDDLLNDGLAGQENLIGTRLQLGAQLVVQQLLERETTEQLGRGHDQHRRPDEPLRGHRNGYEPGRLRTAEGEITVQIPQVRDCACEGLAGPAVTGDGQRSGYSCTYDWGHDAVGLNNTRCRSPATRAQRQRPTHTPTTATGWPMPAQTQV